MIVLQFEAMRSLALLLLLADVSSGGAPETVVLVGVDDSGGLRVALVSPGSGALRWEFQTPKAFGYHEWMDRQVRLEKDRVYVGASLEGRVYAVDLKTGRADWTYDYGSTSCIFIETSKEYVVLSDYPGQKTVCVRRADGKEVWNHPQGGHVRVRGSVVLVGGQSSLCFGLDLATGKELWKVEGQRMLLDADEEHVIASDTSARTYCLDARTGKELWTIDQPCWSGRIADHRVVLGRFGRDTILCHDLSRGDRIWEGSLGTGSDHPTIWIENGTVFASTYNFQHGRTEALDLATGRDLYRFEVGRGMPYGPPLFTASARSLVHASLQDGRVYWRDARSGAERWSATFDRNSLAGACGTRSRAIVGTTAGVFGYDASGRKVWSIDSLHLKLFFGLVR